MSVYEFGPFRYDAAQHLLFRGGAVVSLVPKAAETLQALIERRGRVVEKAELIRAVWGDTAVEEVGVARNISILRKALGDDSETYIQTIPTRGYRFVAEVVEKAEPAPMVAARLRRWLPLLLAAAVLAGFVYWQFYHPSAFVRPSYAGVAVVPFERLSPDLDSTFTEALNEILVAELTKIPGLTVISPSTVQRYRRFGIPASFMARILCVQVTLEGAAQHSGDRLRITARLADVHSGRLIWAETYDRPAADPAQAQADVARAVAATVAARLTKP